MTALEAALTSAKRLHDMLHACYFERKVVPQVLIDNELRLLTERVRAMGNPEPTVFDLSAYRRVIDAHSFRNREADEMPEPCSGVAEIEDGS